MNAGSLGVYFFLFLALYFEVFLVISFFEKRPKDKTAARPKRFPTVSVVVPCWNEEKTLAGTVNSLLALDYPKDKLEVIIVDDGSTDHTFEIAKSFESNPQVKVYSKLNGGKYTALNWGIENSESDIIGCLDADSFVMPDALIESIKKFEENPKTMAVVPAMKVHRPRNLLELTQAVEYTFGVFVKKVFDNIAAISVLPGPFSLYRREVFNKVGKFRHAHNTEDMEMAFRMHYHGLHIENAHTAVVYTNVPRNIRSLLKQRTRWSQGFLENSKDYRHLYFNPRYGNFGMLVLPFSLAMFFGALYMMTFLIYNTLRLLITRTTTWWMTKIPLHAPTFRFDWFYFNTSMLTFLAVMTFSMTLMAILIGRRIAGANFGFWSLMCYFTIYGFIAPVWLARAAWNSARFKQAPWR